MQNIPLRAAQARARAITARLAAAVLTITLATATACGGDSATEPNNNKPQGTYALRQIDGSALPFNVHWGPWSDPVSGHFYNKFVLDITGGAIELDGKADFKLTFDVSYVGDGVPGTTTLKLQGSYETTDSGIIFMPNTGGTIEASLDKGAITFGLDFMNEQRPLEYAFRR